MNQKLNLKSFLLHRMFIVETKKFIDTLCKNNALAEHLDDFLVPFIQLYVALFELCHQSKEKKK